MINYFKFKQNQTVVFRQYKYGDNHRHIQWCTFGAFALFHFHLQVVLNIPFLQTDIDLTILNIDYEDHILLIISIKKCMHDGVLVKCEINSELKYVYAKYCDQNEKVSLELDIRSRSKNLIFGTPRNSKRSFFFC